MIRVATSKMSCRLCEMSTTARPCSASRATRSSTWRVWATPSAAVGSSRITTREFQSTARATATDCRWPPESVATSWRIERIVVTESVFERLGRLRLHDRLLQALEPVVHLAAEVHVLDDVQVVAEREVLVDDLDAEARRVLRPVDRDRPRLEQDLAGVGRVDAGDALDERRLARAVVADEGHHLAGAHLEVDVGQRLDGAEALRQPADLEDRRGRARLWCFGRRHLEERSEGAPMCPLRPLTSYLQYFLNAPTQTSLRFRNLSVKRSL